MMMIMSYMVTEKMSDRKKPYFQLGPMYGTTQAGFESMQGLTNLMFVCTDFRARKMVLRTRLCTQNYIRIKQ